jgi:hypothetical protein
MNAKKTFPRRIVTELIPVPAIDVIPGRALTQGDGEHAILQRGALIGYRPDLPTASA